MSENLAPSRRQIRREIDRKIDHDAYAKAGSLAGLNADDMPRQELARLNYSLFHGYGGAGLIPLFEKYLGRPYIGDRLDIEDITMLLHKSEVILRSQPDNMSYGLYLPTYLKAMRTSSVSQKHRAMLLGALSVDTVSEFKTAVDLIHSDAECTVVDIAGDRTRSVQGVKFVEGNALDLGEMEGQFDSVHTNFLSDKLVAKSLLVLLPGANRRRMFHNIRKALHSGGKAIMVESVIERNDFSPHVLDPDTLAREMEQAGFIDVNVVEAQRFQTRFMMERFLREPHKGIRKNVTTGNQYSLSVTGTKP